MTNEDILTAENTVLGACLCDAPLWGTVLNALHETDLAGDASRAILHAARMLDAEGKILTPGFLDQHVHITGGGGEGSFHTRTP